MSSPGRLRAAWLLWFSRATTPCSKLSRRRGGLRKPRRSRNAWLRWSVSPKAREEVGGGDYRPPARGPRRDRPPESNRGGPASMGSTLRRGASLGPRTLLPWSEPTPEERAAEASLSATVSEDLV